LEGRKLSTVLVDLDQTLVASARIGTWSAFKIGGTWLPRETAKKLMEIGEDPPDPLALAEHLFGMPDAVIFEWNKEVWLSRRRSDARKFLSELKTFSCPMILTTGLLEFQRRVCDEHGLGVEVLTTNEDPPDLDAPIVIVDDLPWPCAGVVVKARHAGICDRNDYVPVDPTPPPEYHQVLSITSGGYEKDILIREIPLIRHKLENLEHIGLGEGPEDGAST
jgi:hypothetical protein